MQIVIDYWQTLGEISQSTLAILRKHNIPLAIQGVRIDSTTDYQPSKEIGSP